MYPISPTGPNTTSMSSAIGIPHSGFSDEASRTGIGATLGGGGRKKNPTGSPNARENATMSSALN
jgi:hypothetical protein